MSTPNENTGPIAPVSAVKAANADRWKRVVLKFDSNPTARSVVVRRGKRIVGALTTAAIINGEPVWTVMTSTGKPGAKQEYRDYNSQERASHAILKHCLEGGAS
jgi:hypothetical protein